MKTAFSLQRTANRSLAWLLALSITLPSPAAFALKQQPPSEGAGLEELSVALQGRRKVSTPSAQLTADEFEEELSKIVGENAKKYGWFMRPRKGVLKVRGRSYPYTLPGVDYSLLREPTYFRVGDLFFVNIEAVSFALSDQTIQRFFGRILPRYDKCLLVKEISGDEHGWLAYLADFSGGEYRALAYLISVLVALQEIQREIQGRVFIDVGSRNGWIGMAALRLGAKRALLIEPKIPTIPFIGVPLQERFSIPQTGSLIDVNLKLNGLERKAEVYPMFLSEVPEMELRNAVLAYNVQHFGIPYFNSPLALLDKREQHLLTDAQRRVQNRVFRQERRNLLEDVVAKFKGIRWIVAGGGDEYDQKDLEQTAKELSLEKAVEVIFQERVSVFDDFDMRTFPATLSAPALAFKVDKPTPGTQRTGNTAGLEEGLKKEEPSRNFTRRRFLTVLGVAAGAAALDPDQFRLPRKPAYRDDRLEQVTQAMEAIVERYYQELLWFSRRGIPGGSKDGLELLVGELDQLGRRTLEELVHSLAALPETPFQKFKGTAWTREELFEELSRFYRDHGKYFYAREFFLKGPNWSARAMTFYLANEVRFSRGAPTRPAGLRPEWARPYEDLLADQVRINWFKRLIHIYSYACWIDVDHRPFPPKRVVVYSVPDLREAASQVMIRYEEWLKEVKKRPSELAIGERRALIEKKEARRLVSWVTQALREKEWGELLTSRDKEKFVRRFLEEARSIAGAEVEARERSFFGKSSGDLSTEELVHAEVRTWLLLLRESQRPDETLARFLDACFHEDSPPIQRMMREVLPTALLTFLYQQKGLFPSAIEEWIKSFPDDEETLGLVYLSLLPELTLEQIHRVGGELLRIFEESLKRKRPFVPPAGLKGPLVRLPEAFGPLPAPDGTGITTTGLEEDGDDEDDLEGGIERIRPPRRKRSPLSKKARLRQGVHFIGVDVAEVKALLGRRRYAEAEGLCGDTIRRDGPDNPKSAGAYFLRARARMGLVKFLEAEEDLTRALQLSSPDDRRIAGTYLLRAKARNKQQGRYREAEEDATEALKREPENPGAYFERALARYRLGKFRGAREDARKVLTFGQQNPTAGLVLREILKGRSSNAGLEEKRRSPELSPLEAKEWYSSERHGADKVTLVDFERSSQEVSGDEAMAILDRLEPDVRVRWDGIGGGRFFLTYVSGQQTARGDQEQERASGFLKEAASSLVEISKKGRPVAVLIDRQLTDATKEDLTAMGEQLSTILSDMVGAPYKMVFFDFPTEDAEKGYLESDYAIVHLKASTHRNESRRNTVYIQRPPPNEPIPVGSLSAVVMGALDLWWRVKGEPVLFDASQCLNSLRGLLAEEVRQVIRAAFSA